MANPVERITDVLGVAGSITTLISLAALSILVAYLLGGQWLRGQRAAAKDAITNRDNEALARLLGGTAVPLDSLTPDQKFNLATEELRTRSRNRIITYSLVFFAFLALLIFAFSLVFLSSREPKDGENNRVVKLDVLRALDILRLVPVEGRQAACIKLLSEQECEQAKEMLAALQYEEPTSEQKEILDQAQATGTITATQVQELAACSGNFNFRVQGGKLQCADGSPVSYVGSISARRALTAHDAIVFHATATAENSFGPVSRLVAQGRPASGSFPGLPGPLAHVVISRSGAVVQSASFDARAAHVGRGGTWQGVTINNSNSIAIELINLGGNRQPYTDQQIAAAEGVARALVQAYGIRSIVGHSDVDPVRRANEPGPLFPMASVRRAAGLTPG